MTRRKGEIGRSQLQSRWPHHVVLPAEAVRGLANAETVRGFAGTFDACGRRPYSRASRGKSPVWDIICERVT
jgi:hypothetical protein